MPIRSPFVSKDKQIREAMEILRENDVATDVDEIQQELEGQQSDLNGGGGDMGDRFYKETMPEDACKRLKGIPIIDPETGNQACVIRNIPKDKRSYEVRQLQKAEE